MVQRICTYRLSLWSLTPDQLGSSDHDLDPLGFPQELLCSKDFVAELLISLDPSKSSGVDGISAKMLRSAAYSIASSLTNLFNQSLTTGIYPKEWKLARIVPIPKSDCPGTSVTGYRPISILSIVSKVLERHVKDTIDEFLIQTHPISDCQWGFMHHRSSVSALIAVTHDWLSALDSGHEVCVVFFDVKKAFDSVPHVPLLEKLSEIGLNPYIIRWIKSYLMDREQFVVVDGASSDPLQVLSGIPQGSVLGPLFLLSTLMMWYNKFPMAAELASLQMTSHCTESSILQMIMSACSPTSMQSVLALLPNT